MSASVLITGASTGFGRDAAERLARRGHHVFATMRDIEGRNADHRESLERLASREELRLQVLELDVTDEESVRNGVLGALRQAGHLDVVINNAGVAGIGVTEAYTAEQFQRIDPADGKCVSSYGKAAAYADNVLGTFKAAIGAPDAPGSEEVAETLVRLVEMAPADRRSARS